MALYAVKRTDSTDYDQYDVVMVRAGSEKEALSLVCRNDPDDGPDSPLYRGFRIDGSNAVAEKVPATGQAEVILASYLAG